MFSRNNAELVLVSMSVPSSDDLVAVVGRSGSQLSLTGKRQERQKLLLRKVNVAKEQETMDSNSSAQGPRTRKEAEDEEGTASIICAKLSFPFFLSFFLFLSLRLVFAPLSLYAGQPGALIACR